MITITFKLSSLNAVILLDIIIIIIAVIIIMVPVSSLIFRPFLF